MKTPRYMVQGLLVMALGLSSCSDHNQPGVTPDFPERINFTSARLYPEGIEYSTQLRRFLVSSITQGKVGTVDENGQYADLLTDNRLISAIGMEISNGRLYVANGDQGVSVKSTPQTRLKTAGLFVFNLETRQLEQWADLAALLPDNQHFGNDVAVDAQGNAYVTDSFSPVVYKVTSAGQPSILATDPRFGGAGFNLNGIVYHPNGYLIVAKSSEGKLFKIDLMNGNAISEVTGFPALTGADGMVWANGDLYVVNGRTRVTQLRSSDNWSTATVIKTDQTGYADATTNTAVNGQVYTLNARISEVGAAAQANNPNLLQANEYSIQRFR
ncbi:SMP-30/gluconolactonase/LRE family protein [Nibrella saemangeumensis]|uniref:SMP-30/gluconolactonase/LRE family protein n=1 Tax=Nibrella saemangeumensis TaxID=1084526 RepID=A0ABP8NI02_9BACT